MGHQYNSVTSSVAFKFNTAHGQYIESVLSLTILFIDRKPRSAQKMWKLLLYPRPASLQGAALAPQCDYRGRYDGSAQRRPVQHPALSQLGYCAVASSVSSKLGAQGAGFQLFQKCLLLG